MADVVRDILIRLLGDDQTGAALSSFSSGVTDITGKISGVTQPIQEFSEKLAVLEAAAIAMGAALGAVAIKEASQFSEKIEEIGSLVNATPAQVDALGESVQELAKSNIGASSSFEQIQNATYNATSALGSTSAAIDIMSVSAKGAEVGATDLNTSTSLLTGTLNAYGLVTTDSATNNANAERVMAALFTTVQNGVVNMQGLADNMGKVAANASGAGVPIEQVGASIATLTGAGVNAEQSFTKLNALLLELTAPSDALKTALGGVSLEANGLPAVLDALQTATGGSTTKFNELFGSSEAAAAALILSNDSAGKFDTTLNAMSSSVQNFNENFDQMTGGVANSSQSLTNNIKSLFIDAGKPLQDDWQNILSGLIKITEGTDLALKDGAFDAIYDAFDNFSENALEFLTGVAEAIPEALDGVDFTRFVDSFGELGGAIIEAFGDLDLTNPEDLQQVLQAMTDGATNLNLFFAEFGRTLTPLVQDIAEFVTKGGESGSTAATVAGRIAGLSTEFNILLPVLTGALSAFTSLAPALTSLAFAGTASAASTFAANIARIGPALSLITGPLGAIAALLISGALIWDDYNKKLVEAEKTQADIKLQTENATKSIEDQNAIFAKIGESTGLVVSNWDDVSKAVDSGVLSYNAANDIYQLTKTGLDALGATVGGVALTHDQLKSAVESGTAIWNEASGKYLTAEQNASALAKSVQDAGGGLGEFNTAGKSNAEIFGDIATAYDRSQKGAAGYGATIDGITLTENQLNSAIDAGLVIWDAQNGRFSTSSEAIDLNSEKVQELISGNDLLAKTLSGIEAPLDSTQRSFKDFNDAFELAIALTKQGSDASVEYVDGLFVVLENTNKNLIATEETSKAVEDTTQANIRGSAEWKNVADSINAATKIANDFQIAAQKLDEQRFEAILTAVVDIDIAEIEAQTERIQSAFESLNVGIESTGTTLTGLVDAFSNLGVLGAGDAYNFIKGQIEDEAARRDKEFELQSQLITAQVQYMDAQTLKLVSGDPLISIEGTELVPELELVLTKIVELAHIKATENALNFLIGVS